MTEPTPGAREELVALLEGIVPTIDALDVSATDAGARLEAAHPMASASMQRLQTLAKLGVDEGWLVPRQAGPTTRFGRLVKDLGGYAVDCVVMTGKALGHTHPRGEINIATAWEGEPTFDGHPPGWMVYPPGSHHVPTVEGGTMLFVYFLPGGEVVWDAT